MNAQAQFWADFYGWCLGLGFVILLSVIFTVHSLLTGKWGSSRQEHRQEMQKMRLRAKLVRKGVDPEYVKFLEKQNENM